MELWKDIVGLENFGQISNYGNVKSKERILNYIIKGKKVSRLLKETTRCPVDNGLGYLSVTFTIKGKSVSKYVHVMVAEAFLEKPFSNEKLEVNHKDLDKSNNCLNNLEWVTKSENLRHYTSSDIFKSKKTIHSVNCSFCKNVFETTRIDIKFCSDSCQKDYFENRKNGISNIPISKNDLYNLLKYNSFLTVGNSFNVSDNAIRKWCKRLDIPHKASYYKKYR